MCEREVVVYEYTERRVGVSDVSRVAEWLFVDSVGMKSPGIRSLNTQNLV